MNKPFLVVTLLVAIGACGLWLLPENNSKGSHAPSLDTISAQFKGSQSPTQTPPPKAPSISSKPVADDHHVSLDLEPVEKEPYLRVASPDSMALIATSDEERNIGPVLNPDEMLYTIEDVEEQNAGTYIEVEMPDS